MQPEQRMASVSEDGASDTKSVSEAAEEKGEGGVVRVFIPPGRGAQLAPRQSAALEERNRNILSFRELGRREWHKRSDYCGRAMVENAVFRYKMIIGRCRWNRTLAGQHVEVQVACLVLNTNDPVRDARQLPSGVIPCG